MSEQRRTPRIQPFVVRCRIVTAGRHIPAYIIDLSLRGARLSLKGACPPVGTTVDIDVRFARASSLSRLAAEIRWVRAPDDKGWASMGVRFASATLEQHARQLEQVLEEFKGHASRLA